MAVTSERTDAVQQTNDDRSIGGLVKHASEQLSTLVREEIKLASLEMSEKGRRAGRGAGLLAGALVFVLYAIGVLIAAGVLGVAQVFEPWLAALIVGGGLLLLAIVCVLVGMASMKRATPPIPSETLASIKADVDALKGRTGEN